MDNTWNQSGTTWGQNTWGTQTQVIISLTGLSSTTTLGELPYAAADDGYGRDAWGDNSWGNNQTPVTLTGLTATTTLGELPYAAADNGWGSDAWGDNDWGQDVTTVPLTGLTATTTVGEFTYAQAGDGWGRDSWGQNSWGIDGINVPLTGLTATSSLPSVGWGNQVFGSDNEGWGGIYQLPVADVMGLTGLSIDADLGTLTTTQLSIVALTALPTLQSTVGLVETDDHSVGLTGLSAETTLGDTTETQLTIAALTGLDIDVDVGVITISSNPVILPGSFTAQTALGSVGVADVMGLTGLSTQTALGALTTTQLSIASLDGLGLTATTILNDAINLQYFNRKVPKDSTGYSRKVPKNSTGYTRKVAN
jgi:hypothetical protein